MSVIDLISNFTVVHLDWILTVVDSEYQEKDLVYGIYLPCLKVSVYLLYIAFLKKKILMNNSKLNWNFAIKIKMVCDQEITEL